MRRQAPGGGRYGVLKQNPFPGETVEVRRGWARIPVGRDVVGAECVDDDDENVGGARRRIGKVSSSRSFHPPASAFDPNQCRDVDSEEKGQAPLEKLQARLLARGEPSSRGNCRPECKDDSGKTIKTSGDGQPIVDDQKYQESCYQLLCRDAAICPREQPD